MKVIKSIVFILIVLSTMTLNIAIAQGPLEVPKKELTPKEQLVVFARQFDVSFEEMSQVIKAESGWNPNVSCGDGGLSCGIAQFNKETFDNWSKKEGEILNYNSAYDQLKLMAWAFSQGDSYKQNWTTWHKVYNK